MEVWKGVEVFVCRAEEGGFKPTLRLKKGGVVLHANTGMTNKEATDLCGTMAQGLLRGDVRCRVSEATGEVFLKVDLPGGRTVHLSTRPPDARRKKVMDFLSGLSAQPAQAKA